MQDFLTLIGQIFLIACVQTVLEWFIDSDKRPQLAKIAGVGCYAAGLYFVVRFVFDNVMSEVLTVFKSVF